jgi:hypothetical protein
MTSLTAPWDRDAVETPVSSRASLTDEEQQAAIKTLLDSSVTDQFPKVDRFYADPIHLNQQYCLHSFVPTQGAQPDSEGVYGFIKCRGTFATADEANQRAEWLIRNADSYHSIQTAYVGRPFPLFKGDYIKETHEVDIRKKAVETISEDIKQKKLDEKKEMELIQEREQKLLNESKEDFVPDPLETYTTLHVKKANLLFTYVETQKKLTQMRESIKRTYKEISEMDHEHPDFYDQYHERYMKARREAFLPEPKETDENFIKYLCEDAPLDFDPREWCV